MADIKQIVEIEIDYGKFNQDVKKMMDALNKLKINPATGENFNEDLKSLKQQNKLISEQGRFMNQMSEIQARQNQTNLKSKTTELKIEQQIAREKAKTSTEETKTQREVLKNKTTELRNSAQTLKNHGVELKNVQQIYKNEKNILDVKSKQQKMDTDGIKQQREILRYQEQQMKLNQRQNKINQSNNKNSGSSTLKNISNGIETGLGINLSQTAIDTVKNLISGSIKTSYEINKNNLSLDYLAGGDTASVEDAYKKSLYTKVETAPALEELYRLGVNKNTGSTLRDAQIVALMTGQEGGEADIARGAIEFNRKIYNGDESKIYDSKNVRRAMEMNSYASNMTSLDPTGFADFIKNAGVIEGSPEQQYALAMMGADIGLGQDPGSMGTFVKSIQASIYSGNNKQKGAMQSLGVNPYYVDKDGKKQAKQLTQVLGEMRIAYQKMDPEQQKNIAKTIAGRNHLATFTATMDVGMESLDKYTKGLTETNGKVDEFNQKIQESDFGKVQEATKNWEAFKEKFGNDMILLFDNLYTSVENLKINIDEATGGRATGVIEGVKDSIHNNSLITKLNNSFQLGNDVMNGKIGVGAYLRDTTMNSLGLGTYGQLQERNSEVSLKMNNAKYDGQRRDIEEAHKNGLINDEQYAQATEKLNGIVQKSQDAKKEIGKVGSENISTNAFDSTFTDIMSKLDTMDNKAKETNKSLTQVGNTVTVNNNVNVKDQNSGKSFISNVSNFLVNRLKF